MKQKKGAHCGLQFAEGEGFALGDAGDAFTKMKEPPRG